MIQDYFFGWVISLLTQILIAYFSLLLFSFCHLLFLSLPIPEKK